MIRILFYTLGCKLNQAETESLAAAFVGAGFPVEAWTGKAPPSMGPLPPAAAGPENGAGPESADHILIINTCTVTSMAEQKARRMIRLALRGSFTAVIVAGCYAELAERDILELEAAGPEAAPGRLIVVSGRLKPALLDLPAFLGSGSGPLAQIRLWRETVSRHPALAGPSVSLDPFRFSYEGMCFHSRIFLKIQDGCERRCAYCRVPLARGNSVSIAPAAALARLQTAEKAGLAETVLTGVNICQYAGPGKTGLAELLELLLEGTKTMAIRLSSIEPEPGLLTPLFLRVLAHPRIRPHFHLSVQSGSGRVLAAMGRFYGPEMVRESAAALRSVKGDPFLACDIITGFPGESEEDFEETRRLCAGLDFSFIHGFPFSPRPGTRAWDMPGRISERLAAERLDRLLELSRRGRAAYLRRWRGKTVDAVAESGGRGNVFPALTDNYLKLELEAQGNRPRPGSAIKCLILEETEDSCVFNEGTFDGRGKMVYNEAISKFQF